MNKKVAIYLRTSTEKQAKGLESQRLALETYLNQQGISEYLTFEDFGVSGAKSKRPGLERLMFAVKRGDVSQVIVYSFSRFARSTSHLLRALEEPSILRSQLDHASKIIVAGNFDNWAPLLFELFSDRGRYFQRKEQMENRVSAYYDQEGELMFIYSQMIRSAISDTGVEKIGMTGIKI